MFKQNLPRSIRHKVKEFYRAVGLSELFCNPYKFYNYHAPLIAEDIQACFSAYVMY